MKCSRFILSSSILFFSTTSVTRSQSPANDRDISYMSSGGQLKPLQAIMDIRHYTVALDVDIPNQSITGYAETDLILSKATDTLLLDLAHLYTIKNVLVDNKKQAFSQQADLIYIVNTPGFKTGRHKIKIEYSGVPPVAVRPPWKGGFSWEKDSSGNPWVIINCQMEGGKVYYPCKDHPSDEPNEGADLIITAPKGLTVLGPGLLKDVKTKKDKQTWHWKTNYTISNYCILFNIGKYVKLSKDYTTVDGNKVPIDVYVLEEDKQQAQKLLELKERDTRVLEKYFGEYPWVKEKIAVAQTPNYGMEHQTMITYGDLKTQFHYEKIGNEDYSANLFHEYGHEWFANKVTNKDWAHMWIQEGIDTYSEALFCREAAGERGYDSMMVMLKNGIRNKKAVVQGEAVNSVDTYTGDIYTKGAFFMHMLRCVLGDSIFFPTLKKLATDTNYTYSHFVTTDDVEQLFSKESGQSLKPLFDLYLRTTDLLNVKVHQTAFQKYTVTFSNLPLPLPMDVITDAGIQNVIVKDKIFTVNSAMPPVIDAKGNYLKHVTLD